MGTQPTGRSAIINQVLGELSVTKSDKHIYIDQKKKLFSTFSFRNTFSGGPKHLFAQEPFDNIDDIPKYEDN